MTWTINTISVSYIRHLYFLSSFLHQVPRGPQVGAYNSPNPRKCPNRCHFGPIKPHACRDRPSNTAGPHGEGGDVTVEHARRSAHQTTRHGAVRCHWLRGSNESRTQKPTQRHVVTVRCVPVTVLHLGKCAWVQAKSQIRWLLPPRGSLAQLSAHGLSGKNIVCRNVFK